MFTPPTEMLLPLSVMCWVPVSSKPPFWATVLRLVFEGGIVRIGAFVTFVPLKFGTLLQSSCQPGLFADISIESAANRPKVGVPQTANSSCRLYFETIHADNEFARPEAINCLTDQPGGTRAGCHLLKLADVNANWKITDASVVPTYFQHTSFVRNGVEFLNQAAPKVIAIALRLRADEIVMRDGAQKLFCSR